MSTINGLPAHVILVHAVVVLVPLSAVFLLLIAFWPAARQRLYVVAAVLSAVTLAFVPLTTAAGEWLEHHLPRTPLIRAHTQIADYMLPWAIGLFVVTLAVAARELLRLRAVSDAPARVPAGAGAGAGAPADPDEPLAPTRTAATHGIGGRTATIVLAVLALIVAGGAVTTVYKIGDSGAKAAWTGNFSPTELPRPPRQPKSNG
ncbi:MAG TPA: hypothetical protein VL595_29860 [Pseudonocardia sp.]|nr:hypothetical protein [Pseudonocardia sp.]